MVFGRKKKVDNRNEEELGFENVTPERKEKGERKKVSVVKRLVNRRKKEHIPRWNVYPTIHTNQPEVNATKRYPTNKVKTTKYTFYNFIPKNLFNQFRRTTNFYFLLIVVITLIPELTPVTPVTSILGLAFVLIVGMIREGWEDFNRFKGDRRSNNRPYEVILPDGTKKTKLSQDLKAGDTIFLQRNQIVPADVLILKSPLPEGVCYVETAQLDGETNLKQLKALKETNAVPEDQIHNLKAAIDCEEPHNHLYTFNAKLHLDGRTYAIDTKQLLLRGASLRNTPYIYGVIVYAGKDTKLALNQKAPPTKFSTVEERLNRMAVGIFFFQIVTILLMAILAGFFFSNTVKHSWYFGSYADKSTSSVAITQFFSYFVLFYFFIPQSLMVTLEVVRVVQAKFMDWDEKMRLDPNDPETGMSAKTSNLNDELALVKYIFSDKTGTLTQNKMEFAQCSINGKVYDHIMKGELLRLLEGDEKENSNAEAEYVADFLRALSLCHSVIADEDPESKELIYQAQSPDELALLYAAKANGFVFKSSKSDGTTIEELGKDKLYPVLALLEFTSERARSSVIVRTPDGKIVLYSKGADSKMFKCIDYSNEYNSQQKKKIEEDVNHFSTLGLRTLIVAKKELSEEEFNSWYQKYHVANTSLKDRAKELAEVSSLIEGDLDLVGCTAIEDKLQDGVPETIDNLLKAGIKVWIITGDKQETAINIGYSTKLLRENEDLAIINVGDSDTPSTKCLEEIKRHLQEHKEKTFPIGVVIDGESLIYALKDHGEEFLQLTDLSSSVVCCRVTPLQKAQIVRLVKNSKKEVTLAIGDGANDVSMIQEAHIGVGIYGKEGTQAARASDYSIQQFRHLQRLITVHGRYSFIRNTKLIHVSFYKNLAFFFTQFWFSFFNGYSAQTLYDDWIITFFNIILTSGPPFFLGIFEKDLKEDVLEKNPQVYKQVSHGRDFSLFTLARWYAVAFFQSWIFWMVGWLVFRNDMVLPGGRNGGMYVMGIYISTIGVLSVLTQIALVITYWTIPSIVFHILSVVAYFTLLLLISIIPIWEKGYWAFFNYMAAPSFYFTVLLGWAMAIFPIVSIGYIKRVFFPSKKWRKQRDRIIKEEDPLPIIGDSKDKELQRVV